MLTVREEAGVTFVTMSGPFETFGLPTFSERVEKILGSGVKKVCMNFRGLTFINSTALGYLITVGKRLREEDGALAFSEPSRVFRSTFMTVGLHHLFELYETDADAIDALSG